MEEKLELVLPFLQAAGLVDSPPAASQRDRAMEVLRAAGDRVKVAGDILQFADFFLPDDQLPYNEKDLEKRLRKPPEATALLADFRNVLARAERFDAETLEKLLHDFVARREIKIGQIIHALRVAVTGKSVGFGMFDTLAILGRESCLRRIDRALELAASR